MRALPADDDSQRIRTGEARLSDAKHAEIFGNRLDGIEADAYQVGVQFEASATFSGGSVASPTVTSPFSVALLGLLPGATYAYRAYANTSAGQYVGEIRTFTLPAE